MKKEFFKINNIPAVLWGDNSKNLIIAIHGNMSFKEDVPIKILAEIALEKNIITEFTNKFNCNLSVSKESEHWFHTENDLRILKEWIEKIL